MIRNRISEDRSHDSQQQLPCHLSGVDKPHLQWSHSRRIAHCLHEWHPYSLQQPGAPHKMDNEDIGTPMGAQTIPETGEVLLRQSWSWILRHDRQRRTCWNGPGQICCHLGMETFQLCERSMVVHWVLQLLLKVHSWLLHNCLTPPWPNQKGGEMGLDNCMQHCI